MFKRDIQYSERMSNLFPELFEPLPSGERVLTRTMTFQVTDACNLKCSYCYQINKGVRIMSFETAKKVIDYLLSDTCEYINTKNSPFIIIEFIGGEPFLEVELMDKIVCYFQQRTIELNHPWASRFCISVCSNGTLYFEPKVQEFLYKHQNHLSFSITIDGNKELHDSCRVFYDGRGSYDLAYAAAVDWRKHGFLLGSKITMCPANVPYIYDALRYFIDDGYTTIFANCVYEEGWEKKDCTIIYNEMKKIADYLIDNQLHEKIYLSFFENNFFKPKEEGDDDNWCGGTGMMLAVDPDGYYYPCIRYMESSIGTDQPPLRIGHVDRGIMETDEDRQVVKCLNCINRRSQSTDECYYCPIADGCSWCSGYNYQLFGTPDKRATFICDTHKARSLVNVYYWNKQGIHMDLNCPKEWALEIISEDEYEMLRELADSTRVE